MCLLCRPIYHATFIVGHLKMAEFSADCSAVNPNWKIEIKSSQLPAVDGTEMPYKCPKKYAKKNTNMKVVCQDGDFIISPGGPLPCTKIGKFITV